jgi:hypothetical protein
MPRRASMPMRIVDTVLKALRYNEAVVTDGARA